MAKQAIQELLLNTKGGDLALRALERLTGLGVVRLEEIEHEQVAVTPTGKAAAKVRAPASGD